MTITRSIEIMKNCCNIVVLLNRFDDIDFRCRKYPIQFMKIIVTDSYNLKGEEKYNVCSHRSNSIITVILVTAIAEIWNSIMCFTAVLKPQLQPEVTNYCLYTVQTVLNFAAEVSAVK